MVGATLREGAQLQWVASALTVGFDPSQIVVCEWTVAVTKPGTPQLGEAAEVPLAAFARGWERFAAECSATVAPEATYQAWLAHFLMAQFGVLRVVREVDFGSRYLDPETAAAFPGHNLMLDVMVLRAPLVNLPRRAHLARAAPEDPLVKSGLSRLQDFAIVCEMKVGSTQGNGVAIGSIVRDVRKLDALLRAGAGHYPGIDPPVAVMVVLDNHPTKALNRQELVRQIAREVPGTPVQTLIQPPERQSGH